ncbi:hypothetical protein GE09DRAFT_787257 [Coniochaeta sp. 2T2.1]|nr:hypothetical protein GE09DRAFT_787257 [Coniochaeta sp. 2T2.1]
MYPRRPSMQPHLLAWWEANSGYNDSSTPEPTEDTNNNTSESLENTHKNTDELLEDGKNTPEPLENTDNTTPGPLETYILNLHKRQRSVSQESDTDSELGPSPKKNQRLASPEVLTITLGTTVAECDPNPLKHQYHDNEELGIDHAPKRQRMSIEFLLNKTPSKQQRIGHVKIAPRNITPEPEQSNTTNLFAPEVYPRDYIPYQDTEPKYVPITQEDCKS